MQWRALVMLLVGIATIYLVSLLSSPPLPRPTHVFASYPDPSTQSRLEPNDIILSIVDDELVQTLFWHEVPVPNQIKYGVGPIKAGVVGKVQQKRIALDMVHSNSTDKTAWTTTFEHDFQGPISKISRAPPSQEQQRLHFGAMYHILDEEDIRHVVRLYYQAASNMPFLFKDVILPGSSWIDAFTLERDYILYSRDPDQYRFRLAELPSDLLHFPQPVIQLENTIAGEMVKKGHQPRLAEKHRLILARMYSPNPDTFRVFSLDVHKTPSIFHINVVLTDGNMGASDLQWKDRDRGTYTPSVYSDGTVQYMAFADGAHFRHDRVETNMPRPIFARAADAKTVVAPYIQNSFLTFDYTDRIDILQHNRDERKHLYKEKGEFLPEYYFWFEEDLTALDETDIVGMEINKDGNVLAVWTQVNALYIFMRGSPGRQDTSPHNRVAPLAWSLKMVETGLTSSPIGAVAFWNATLPGEDEQKNYMVVSLKNQETHVYWLDRVEESKHPDIWNFITMRWDMLLAMSLLLSMFVFSELHRPA